VTKSPIDPDPRGDGNVTGILYRPRPNLLDVNNNYPPMRLEVSKPILDYSDIAQTAHISAHTNVISNPTTEHLLSGGLG